VSPITFASSRSGTMMSKDSFSEPGCTGSGQAISALATGVRQP